MTIAALDRASVDLAALKSGVCGRVDIGTIMSPGMSLVPRAIAAIKARAPRLHIGVQIESSDRLFDKLASGAIDFMIGRPPTGQRRRDLAFEPFDEEQLCIVVRQGHPLQKATRLALHEIVSLPWILPARGSVLRARLETVLDTLGLAPPADVIDADALLVVTALLRYTDALHVMPVEVARHQQALGVMHILPVDLSCRMEAFGILRCTRRSLSPGAALLLQAVRDAAAFS